MHRVLCAFIIIFCLQSVKVKAQVFNVDTIQYSGNTSSFINIVILGDGYTKHEQDKFEIDAIAFRNYFFNQLPLALYKNYFNVFVVKVISEESGIKHPHNAYDCPDSMPASNPQTFFGASFDRSGIHRLVALENTAAVGNVLSQNFPEYDQVVILANSNFYGGSGGLFPVATVHSASNEIVVHELGHSFAHLADEYWAGAGYAAEGPNRTRETNPETITWKNWIGINGIGLYSYGGTSPLSMWYRPHEYCKMQYLGYPFCSVCSETIIEKIHSLVHPVSSFKPSNRGRLTGDSVKSFSVQLIKPLPNTLRTQWFINNNIVAVNTDSIVVNPAMFSLDENIVKVSVVDTSDMIRIAGHSKDHNYSLTWNVSRSATSMRAPVVRFSTMEVCAGNSTALSVANPQAGVTYNWYTDSIGGSWVGQGANFITPAISEEVAYYVQAFYATDISPRTKVTLKVLPVPEVIPVAEAVDEICYGGVARLRVLAPDSTLDYRWYTTATSIQPVGDDTLMVTPPLTTGRTYFLGVVSKKNSCTGNTRAEVVIPVMPEPQKPVVTVTKNTSSEIKLNWTAVPGASSYQVSIDEGLNFVKPGSGARRLTHKIKKMGKTGKLTVIVKAMGIGNCNSATTSEAITFFY